jgi:hypothetical protein
LLFVRTVPEGAHVWLDGRRMASPPFDVTLPRGTDHTLDVRSEGYEPSSQVLRVEADTKLTVTLKRAPTVQTPASAPTRRPLESHARRAGFVTSSPY